jgi:hypothetical protein
MHCVLWGWRHSDVVMLFNTRLVHANKARRLLLLLLLRLVVVAKVRLQHHTFRIFDVLNLKICNFQGSHD